MKYNFYIFTGIIILGLIFQLSCKKEETILADNAGDMAGTRHWHGTLRVFGGINPDVITNVEFDCSILVLNNKKIAFINPSCTKFVDTLEFVALNKKNKTILYVYDAMHFFSGTLDSLVYYYSENKMHYFHRSASGGYGNELILHTP